MIRSRETERNEDIWSAIQYLDPDCGDKGSNRAVIVTAISVVVLVFAVWVLLQLRGL
jgi:hypothetical protein